MSTKLQSWPSCGCGVHFFFATRKMPIELSRVIRETSVHVFGLCTVNKAQITHSLSLVCAFGSSRAKTPREKSHAPKINTEPYLNSRPRAVCTSITLNFGLRQRFPKRSSRWHLAHFLFGHTRPSFTPVLSLLSRAIPGCPSHPSFVSLPIRALAEVAGGRH